MRSARIALFSLLVCGVASAATTPVILSIDPSQVVAGSPSFTLTVNGANFASGASVRANGVGEPTTFVSSSKLTATIPSTLLINTGSISITVTNLGTAASSPVTLSVIANNPQITSLDPSSVPKGNQNVTVAVNGSAFASSAIVRVNNIAHSTTFVSATRLTFVLVPSDISQVTTLNVVVVNPNNKLSNTVTLPVTNGPVPSITLLDPNNVDAGGTAFTLTVVGNNFVSTSQIKVGTTSHTTTFVDASHLTTQITSTEIAKAGTLSITVVNPNNQVSAPATLTVNGTLPTITDISPSTATQGSAGFTMTITGTNFVNNTKVNIGTATPRNATFVDSQHVTVLIFPSDIDTAGAVPISVTTPAPSGGTSNVLNLTVVSPFAPVLKSMTPSAVPAGSATFKLLITGTNFKSDDVVQFNGGGIATEFISSTQIAGTITSDLVASAGTALITVARKDGSATSAPLTLTITSADAPLISSLTPPNASVGGAPFTLVITGSNFTSSSVVTVDSSPRTTTFVSATELHVDFTSADLASAHDFQIQVVNPGGLASLISTLSVTVPVPAISSIAPDTVVSGQSGFQLKVTGDNFSPTSVINVGGVPHYTQVQQSTGALLTTVTDADISAPGTLAVTVTDNGATSAPVNLTILRPSIDSIDPSALLLGSLSATLRVSGSAFLPTSKVVFKGADQPTTFNSDGSLTAIINGADLLTPGQFAVNVRNSPFSLSAPMPIFVVSPGTPEISSVSPVFVGSTTITVDGAHFVPLSVVRINGTDRTTTFLGGSQLSATLESGDAAAPGSFVVTVRNPDGTTSNSVTVTVSGPFVIPIHRRGARH